MAAINLNKEPDWEHLSVDEMATLYSALQKCQEQTSTGLEEKKQILHEINQKVILAEALHEEREAFTNEEKERKRKNKESAKEELMKQMKDFREDHAHDLSVLRFEHDEVLEEIKQTDQDLLELKKEDNIKDELLKCREMKLNDQEALDEEIAKKKDEIKLIEERINEKLRENSEISKQISRKKQRLNEINEQVTSNFEIISEINAKIKTFQEEMARMKAEIEKSKCTPLDPTSKGNSMFSEVHDRNHQLERKLRAAEANLKEKKRNLSNILRDFEKLDDENSKSLSVWNMLYAFNGDLSFPELALYRATEAELKDKTEEFKKKDQNVEPMFRNIHEDQENILIQCYNVQKTKMLKNMDNLAHFSTLAFDDAESLNRAVRTLSNFQFSLKEKALKEMQEKVKSQILSKVSVN